MPSPNSTDSNFERTFADLAYARLRDKAPSLLDFLVGFQLIDKNEDETHAVGVFGFKVGGEWIYAPVFFINGELKGHELMYIKNQDAFVPMTEEWVNYILNRRPSLLGETEKTPLNNLGVRQPDFDLFARAPYIGSKYASARPTFQQICKTMNQDYVPFMSVFTVSPAAEKYAKLDKRFSLPHALNALGEKAAFLLFNTMRKDEAFADAVLQHYSINDLVGHAKTAAKVSQEEAGYKEKVYAASKCKNCEYFKSGGSCTLVAGKIDGDGGCNYFEADKENDTPIGPLDASQPAGTKTAADKHNVEFDGAPYRKDVEKKVVVLTRGDDLSAVMKDLDDGDRKKLMQDQYVVKDERSDDQRARLYRSQLAATLQGPTENGIYDVISSDASKRKVAVILNPIQIGYAYNRRPNGALLIDPENKQHALFHSSDVLVAGKHGDLDELPLVDASSLKYGDIAILVDPDGDDTTTPFNVSARNDLPDGTTELRVYSECHVAPTSSSRSRTAPMAGDTNDAPEIEAIVLTNKESGQATRIGGAYFVPKTWKAFVLYKGKGDDMMPRSISERRPSTLNIGSLSDLLLKINKSAAAENACKMRMLTDGIRFQVEINGRQGQGLSKLAMLKHLIVDHQLAEQDAQTLLKEAAPKKAQTYWIKYAYNSQPTSAFFPEANMGSEYGVNAPVQYPQEIAQNLGSNDSHSNREFYRDDRSIDQGAKYQAQAAASAGQKEVLDTSVISGLVKAMDTDTQVDGYIGDLLLGLDRLGRILFMFYWHNDKFKERYGQQDMVELEDNLRNVFKNLGELALFLKQKTIEPDASRNSEAELTQVLS